MSTGAGPPGVAVSRGHRGRLPELVEAFARLIPQLSSSNPPPTADELAAIVASPASVLLVARDGSGTVVGLADPGRLPGAHRAPGLDRGRGGGRVGPGSRCR